MVNAPQYERCGVGNDTIAGDLNIDTVTYAWTTAGVVVNLSLASNQAVGTESGTDQLATVENVIGGSGNDSIDTSAVAVTNNTLDGGAGTDTLAGGTGNDTYIVDTFLDVIVEAAGAGTDTVISAESYIFHANVENVTLTGNGNFGVIGNELANVINGNSGGNGILGGLGNDTISGGDGNDVINGEGGTDSMSGGTGIDVYFFNDAGDTVTEVDEAGVYDTIWTTQTLTLPDFVEILILDGGILAINGTGNDGPADNTPNLMLGNNAANTLTTFGGDDVINTGAGSAAGVEIISGGLGNDTLTSGGGHDFFTYESITEGGDTITDFVTAGGDDLDILDLRPMFFPTFANTGGITTVALAVASGHLTFTQVGADTQVFADADGGADSNVLLATLVNTTAAAVQVVTLI